jgi:hypothetical protein
MTCNARASLLFFLDNYSAWHLVKPPNTRLFRQVLKYCLRVPMKISGHFLSVLR